MVSVVEGDDGESGCRASRLATGTADLLLADEDVAGPLLPSLGGLGRRFGEGGEPRRTVKEIGGIIERSTSAGWK